MKTGLDEKALKISVNGAVKKPPLFERSEFGGFQRNEMKFSFFITALTFWYFCVKAKVQRTWSESLRCF
jgi:hypothetical protein